MSFQHPPTLPKVKRPTDASRQLTCLKGLSCPTSRTLVVRTRFWAVTGTVSPFRFKKIKEIVIVTGQHRKHWKARLYETRWEI